MKFKSAATQLPRQRDSWKRQEAVRREREAGTAFAGICHARQPTIGTGIARKCAAIVILASIVTFLLGCVPLTGVEVEISLGEAIALSGSHNLSKVVVDTSAGTMTMTAAAAHAAAQRGRRTGTGRGASRASTAAVKPSGGAT